MLVALYEQIRKQKVEMDWLKKGMSCFANNLSAREKIERGAE